MELLNEEINKNGFLYKLALRGEKAMIYKQTDKVDGRIWAWEVFKKKVDKPKIIFGVQMNEREIFPGNEDFGKWAWSMPSFERAKERFDEIEEDRFNNDN